MTRNDRAPEIRLLDFKSKQMRTFHLTWIAFFTCFFAWFATAPLMPVIRAELALSKAQMGNIVMASMVGAVVMRLLLGHICDRYGPRKTYSWLLILGSVPVMTIGLARSYETFLAHRLIIGGIGASFVLTQYHTAKLFAPRVVGTACATTAGWGNLGGAVAQIVMPLLLGVLLSLGAGTATGWRLAMFVPGAAMIVCGVLYWKFACDPEGSVVREETKADTLLSVLGDYRVLALALLYGACFGVELVLYSVASTYFADRFDLSLKIAGMVAGVHGLLNVFARTLGGSISDRIAEGFGLRGRANVLGIIILLEGISICAFSRMDHVAFALVTMVGFSFLVQLGCGATYGLVPFVKKERLGVVAGVVGAGGNLGAIAAGFLFTREGLSLQSAFGIIGLVVMALSGLALVIRFAPEGVSVTNAGNVMVESPSGDIQPLEAGD